MKRHIPTRYAGIYYSERQGGKRSYEVRYRDSAGKDRFKTCGDKLQDALDVQADIRVRKRRGEKVAPNRMLFSETVELWRKHRRGNDGKPKKIGEKELNEMSGAVSF